MLTGSPTQIKNKSTHHFDVLEAGEDQVLQKLAADPSCSHHQDLTGGQRVRQLFTEGAHQLDHDDLQTEEAAAAGS